MYISPDATMDATAKAKAVAEAKKAIEEAKKAVAKANAFLEDNGLNPITEDWLAPEATLRKGPRVEAPKAALTTPVSRALRSKTSSTRDISNDGCDATPPRIDRRVPADEYKGRATTTRASRATILPQHFLMNAPKITTIQHSDHVESAASFSRPTNRRATILPDWMTNPRLKNKNDGITSSRVCDKDADEPTSTINTGRRDSTVTILPVEAEDECEDCLSDRARTQSATSSPRHAPPKSANARDTTQHYNEGPRYTETAGTLSPRTDTAPPPAIAPPSKAPRVQPSPSIPSSRAQPPRTDNTRASAPAQITAASDGDNFVLPTTTDHTSPADHSASMLSKRSSCAGSPRRAANLRSRRKSQRLESMASVETTNYDIAPEQGGPSHVNLPLNQRRSSVSASCVSAQHFPSLLCSVMSSSERSSLAPSMEEAECHRLSSRYAKHGVTEELEAGSVRGESDARQNGMQSIYVKSQALEDREDSFSSNTVAPTPGKWVTRGSLTTDSESDHCLANLTSGQNSPSGGNRGSEVDTDGVNRDGDDIIPLVNAPKNSKSVYYHAWPEVHTQDEGMVDANTSLTNAPNRAKSVYFPPHQSPGLLDDQTNSSWDNTRPPLSTHPRDTRVYFAEDNSLSPSSSAWQNAPQPSSFPSNPALQNPERSDGNKLASVGASSRQSSSFVAALSEHTSADTYNDQCFDQHGSWKPTSPRASAVVDVALGLNLGCITNRLTANATKYLEQAAQLQQCADEIADEVMDLGGFPTALRESFDDLLKAYRTWAEDVVRALKVDDRIHLEEAKMIGELYFRSLYDAIRPDIEWEEAVGLAEVTQLCEEFPTDIVYNYTDDLVILYEMALYAQPYVDAVALYVKSRLDSDDAGAFMGQVSVSSKKVKRLGRIVEKIFHASTDHNFPSRVTDMARGMLVFKSMEALARALVVLKESDEINILRVKNRWSEPTHAGWSDIVILFEFIQDHPAEQHVCEFQLVHGRMANADVGKNGQLKYHSMRTCGELLDMFLDRAGGLARITEIAEEVLIAEEHD
eukprot:GEMP01007819.1.p1 GENE.GEMP01007819.1~~GEMP01007819.1.p1  ORF type:complete len:1034 (+),score=220.44 GEMP01007819.1:128-3229(+)